MKAEREILQILKSFVLAVERMFDGHRNALELIADEHDNLLSICKKQQTQIGELEKAISILRVDLNELKFKGDNI